MCSQTLANIHEIFHNKYHVDLLYIICSSVGSPFTPVLFFRWHLVMFFVILTDISNKNHVLVKTVESIWLLFLNILSFTFVQRLNKSVRFRRFKRSYVNRPVVVPTNHCQIFTATLQLLCSKWPHSFYAAVSLQWQCICVTCFCWVHLLFESC